MIDFRNPYTPGAGVMPRYLAGRSHLLNEANKKLQAVKAGYPARSVTYYGLRGVGKTVVLNAIEEQAEALNLLFRHIEVQERKGFVRALSLACTAFALNLSAKESIKSKVSKLASIIASFSATWNPEDNTLSFGLNGDPLESTAGTGDLSTDLTELLVALGKYARDAQTAICFCLDELQYATEDELEALITALHRTNQLGLPILLFCAGLPKLRKTMGDTKSYSERLFEFIEVDSLTRTEAEDAICKPAKALHISYSSDAIGRIISFTEGYPYFIQEMCSTIWEIGTPSQAIDAELVERCITPTNEKLDSGFFSVRYDRCTPREQDFMVAMVRCGELPCTIANVASIMHSTSQSIGPLRAKLISKGLIYAMGRGEVDFTVPQFDDFIRRVRKLDD